LAGALVELSLHTARGALLLAGAVAFFLLAVTARGPLGIARWCGPRVHAASDVAAALALAAGPLVPALRPDALGIVVVEVVALAWLRAATLTRYAPAARGGRSMGTGGGGRGGGEPPVAMRGLGPSVARSPVSPATTLARGLGLFAGRSVRRLPEAGTGVGSRARQAGRHAGRLQRAWRRAGHL
jgi:hypothetical protein